MEEKEESKAETAEERKERKKEEQAIAEGHVFRRKIAARTEKTKQLKPAQVLYSSLGI